MNKLAVNGRDLVAWCLNGLNAQFNFFTYIKLNTQLFALIFCSTPELW